MMKHKILVIDDEFLIRMSLESGLEDLGYQVRCVESAAEGLSAMEEIHPDVILLDNRLGSDTGLSHIAEFRALDEDIIIILMTAYGSIQNAVEAMTLGVSHYIQKPFELEEIDLIIRRSMEQRSRQRSLELMKLRPKKLIGESAAIRQIRDEIRILALNDNVDILICGETGTGKEVVVNTIHENSSRAKEPLVQINCGAIPENLIESELFGYEKGAFTGAAKMKKGLIELADGGTIFFDEIGELPLAMQAKLLTFLEDRKIRRVGGLRDIEVNVRVAAATNRILEDEVAEGRFREDLYYRLNVMQIRIPPLRERKSDIPLLVRYYMEYFNRKFNKNLKDIRPDFLQKLSEYYWKGNVRELRNVMERTVLFSRGDMLTGEENIAFTPMTAERDRQQKISEGAFPLKDLEKETIDLKKETELLERTYIEKAMELSEGNMSRAAQMLGMSRFALKRRLESEPEEGASEEG